MAGYGSDDEFALWLPANGFSLPAGAPAAAVLRQRGSTYIDGLYGPRFPGYPTEGLAQERAWPRTGAEAYGAEIPLNTIPAAVVQASYYAALQEGLEPGSLLVTANASGAIKREKIGQLETEYFEGSGNASADATPTLSAVEGLLAPFLTSVFPMALIV